MAEGGGSTDSETDTSDESLIDAYSSYIAWAAGVFFLLLALGVLGSGESVLDAFRGLIAAVILVAGAVVCLPPTRRRLAAKTNVNVGRWAIVGIAIAALLLAVGIAPASDTPAVDDPGSETATHTQTPTPTEAEPPTETDTVTEGQAGDTPGDLATASPTRTTRPPAATATSTPTASGGSAGTTPSNSGQSTWTVTVVRIIDGDTMEVRFEDGHTEDVRLLGVDTPEVHTENDPSEFEGVPDTDSGHEWLRDWGHRASEYARAELSGETVRIETDSAADRRGSYGRLLVYLTDDDGEFNQRLLRQGYARMYDSSFSKRATYLELEANAQDNDVGVWGFDGGSGASDQTPTPTATPVPDGGTEHDQLAVSEIHADAAGNDHDNLNDEYIVFENTGDEALEMDGWRISDEADHTYTVPQGFTLDPGVEVTLYTGSGEDSETELYWGSERAVWNNNGDTIYVHDDEGTLVLERTYS